MLRYRGFLLSSRKETTSGSRRTIAELALLSGSGSTVFGLFGAGTDVTSIVATLHGEFPGWTLRASRTVASGVRIVPAVT
jgi:4-diphosphocytidyl-2C-methyl-D-erythritol kinase